MTEHASHDDRAEMSRRALIGGAAALGGASLITLAGAQHVAAAPGVGGFPQALAPTLPGLTYISLDAFAFDVPVTGPNVADQRRIYENINGVQPVNRPASVFAPLPIPIGSTVTQINAAYLGEPIISIVRRPFGETTLVPITDLFTMPTGGGPQTHSVSTNATLTHGASYFVEVFCPSGGGSIFGVTIGYVPPTQAFVPFSGAVPRAFDSREAGGGGPIQPGPNGVRTIDLSSKLVPGARSAIINLTADATQGPGFLAVFSAGLADWPGNSSLNYFSAGQIVANNVVTAVTDGKIKVFCGTSSTQFIVDVIGSLI